MHRNDGASKVGLNCTPGAAPVCEALGGNLPFIRATQCFSCVQEVRLIWRLCHHKPANSFGVTWAGFGNQDIALRVIYWHLGSIGGAWVAPEGCEVDFETCRRHQSALLRRRVDTSKRGQTQLLKAGFTRGSDSLNSSLSLGAASGAAIALPDRGCCL